MMGRSRATRNAVSYYFNVIVTAVLGLVFNPLLMTYLGSSAFGIFKATQKFLDFASVADGRATQALKWTIAYKTQSATTNQLRRDVGAAIVVWILALPIVAMIVGAMVFAAPILIANLTLAEVETARVVAFILGANVALMGLFGIPDAVLLGSNLGSRSVDVSTAILIASNLGMVLTAMGGFGVTGVALVAVVAALLNAIITLFVTRRSVEWWGVLRPNKQDVGTLAKFSGWMLGWEMTQKLMLASELLLFSILIGPIGVTNYTFTSYVPQFALSICLLTASAFTPQLGKALGATESREAASITRTVRELVLALITVFGSATLLLNGEFVTLWAGNDRYLGDTLNILMVVAFAQLALIRNDAQFQDAGLRVSTKTIVGLCSAVLSIGLAVLAYHLHPVPWALYAGLIAGRLIANLAFPLLVRRVVNHATYPWRTLVVTAVTLTLAALASKLIEPAGLVELLSYGVGTVVLSAGAAWLGLSVVTRTKVLARFTRRKRSGGV